MTLHGRAALTFTDRIELATRCRDAQEDVPIELGQQPTSPG